MDIVATIYGLRFRNYYNTEDGWDGGVLEISINGGARQDIIDAGGSFVTGGYVFTFPTDWGQLRGRDVWTGDSGGYIDTIVNLPEAAIGQTVQFYWILGTDNNTGADVGWDGWRIDTVAAVPSARASTLATPRIRPMPRCWPTMAPGTLREVLCISAHRSDVDADGQPSADATGDDDDGVTFTSALAAGQDATVDVVASESGSAQCLDRLQ